MPYPRLPDPPAPAPDDTAVLYGCRILHFYLQTGIYCTSNPDQLKAAEYAAYVAVTASSILPIAADRVSAVRHAIAAQLARLDAIAAEAIAQPAARASGTPSGATIGRPGDDGPGNPGSGVPRRPYPIVNPPAASRLPAPMINF